VGNGEGPVLVHFDVDVISAAEMPAKQEVTAGDGLTLAEVSDLLTAIVASPRVIALEITEYDPSRDPERIHARKIVDLVVRAVGRRVQG
jgi:arginase family enzyme